MFDRPRNSMKKFLFKTIDKNEEKVFKIHPFVMHSTNS